MDLSPPKAPPFEDKRQRGSAASARRSSTFLDRLYLSPQCGFASCEIGNKAHRRRAVAKLALVKEIAEEVWGC